LIRARSPNERFTIGQESLRCTSLHGALCRDTRPARVAAH
jgi:hypothetical protein